MGLSSLFKRQKDSELIADNHIDIKVENCDGCEKCTIACPNHVLILVDERCSVRDFQVCKNCKVCMAICPNDCITVN